MKRLSKFIILIIICLSMKTVYAENYKLKELIPYGVDTTIHTDNFSYKGIFITNEGIQFNGIKNLTNEKMPISISIGLFDRKGVNIGTINYCDYYLEADSEMSYIIKFDSRYFAKNKKVNDVKYIAVLGDNTNCRTTGSGDYVGQSVDKLGIIHKNKLDNQVELLLSIITILGGALLIFIVYKLIFTRSYRNMNGNEVRKAYEEINKELKEKHDKENIEILDEKESKPRDILIQEKEAQEEDKSGTDLHNLYK